MSAEQARLRPLLARNVPPVVSLVLDPLSARISAAEEFEALYLGSSTLGYVKTVTEANLTLTQMAHAALEIRAACPLPLILDGQCGWGDPRHVRQTILMSEAAGIAAIEIEDQLMPKRAHHHIGIEHLVPTELMVAKIEAVVGARRDDEQHLGARQLAGAPPCRLRRDEPVRFPILEHFAEVIETAIQRRDIDGH